MMSLYCYIYIYIEQSQQAQSRLDSQDGGLGCDNMTLMVAWTLMDSFAIPELVI